MFDRTRRKILYANTPTAQRNPEIPFSSPFDKRAKEGDLKSLGAPFDAGRENSMRPSPVFPILLGFIQPRISNMFG